MTTNQFLCNKAACNVKQALERPPAVTLASAVSHAASRGRDPGLGTQTGLPDRARVLDSLACPWHTAHTALLSVPLQSELSIPYLGAMRAMVSRPAGSLL